MENAKQSAQDKRKSLIITVCVILAAVIVIGLTVFTRLSDNGTFLRAKTAAQSDNYSVSGTMMAYFYTEQYQTYASYLSYMGVDTSTSLKTQECSVSEGSTWFEYFMTMAQSYVNEVLALCEAANAAGVSLDEEDKAEIEAQIDSLEEMAAYYGYSAKQYLIAYTGNPVNANDVKKCLELTALASKYSTEYTDSLEYTDEEIETYYSENTESFDGVDYYTFTINATDFMEEDVDGNPVGETSTASTSAQAAAEELAACTDGDSFMAYVKNYMSEHEDLTEEEIDSEVENTFVRHALASSIASISDWAFSAKAGESYVSGVEGDTTYTVYLLDKASYRDETKTRSVRHCLFSSDTYDEETANSYYAEWEADGFTEEKMIELANTYSSDTGSNTNGGLYENIAIGETVNEFNDWVYDSSRQPGDHGIISSTYGWHLMYYVGEGDSAAWKLNVISDLKDNDYSDLVETYSSSITFDVDALYAVEA